MVRVYSRPCKQMKQTKTALQLVYLSAWIRSQHHVLITFWKPPTMSMQLCSSCLPSHRSPLPAGENLCRRGKGKAGTHFGLWWQAGCHFICVWLGLTVITCNALYLGIIKHLIQTDDAAVMATLQLRLQRYFFFLLIIITSYKAQTKRFTKCITIKDAGATTSNFIRHTKKHWNSTATFF